MFIYWNQINDVWKFLMDQAQLHFYSSFVIISVFYYFEYVERVIINFLDLGTTQSNNFTFYISQHTSSLLRALILKYFNVQRQCYFVFFFFVSQGQLSLLQRSPRDIGPVFQPGHYSESCLDLMGLLLLAFMFRRESEVRSKCWNCLDYLNWTALLDVVQHVFLQ